MAFAPLKLTGNQKINDTDASAQIMAFTIKGSRDTVEIPATFGTRASVSAGSDKYEVEISFLQDVDATALTQVFWDALADDTGTITFSGTMRSGAVSATNPAWAGTALVTAAQMGGEVDQIGRDSVTFPLLDRPSKTITP